MTREVWARGAAYEPYAKWVERRTVLRWGMSASH